MIAKDTSKAAHAIQMELLRKMGGTARVELVVTMCEQTREVTRSGIRARHPEYTEAKVQQAFARIILGKQLYKKVFPNEDITP